MSETGHENTPPRFELAFAEDGIALETAPETITATFAFVQDEKGNLLTLQNERGWDIPGGHLDEGETLLDATHREVLEESCVTIKDVEFFALIKNGDTAMSVFLAKPDEIKEFVPNEEDPTSDRTWMSIEDFKLAYSGGDKTMMFNLLAKLPASS